MRTSGNSYGHQIILLDDILSQQGPEAIEAGKVLQRGVASALQPDLAGAGERAGRRSVSGPSTAEPLNGRFPGRHRSIVASGGSIPGLSQIGRHEKA